MRISRLLPIAFAVVMTGCGNAAPEAPPLPNRSAAATDPGVPEVDRSDLVRRADSEGSPGLIEAPGDGELRVLFLGTSLTEGLGLELPGTEAWPARVADLADSAGISISAMNAGVGGETSAGALRRLDWVMQQAPDVLVVETGANDGLRGLPPEQMEANLDGIVRGVQERHPGVSVVVTQMEAPPNMGADYAAAFHDVFPRVAERWGTELIPFLLDSVAANPELNQADGIHPTAEGHQILARNAWPVLEEVFRRASRR